MKTKNKSMKSKQKASPAPVIPPAPAALQSLPPAFASKYLYQPGTSESDDHSSNLVFSSNDVFPPELISDAVMTVANAFATRAQLASLEAYPWSGYIADPSRNTPASATVTLFCPHQGRNDIVDAAVKQIADTLLADVVTVDWLDIISGEKGSLGKDIPRALDCLYEPYKPSQQPVNRGVTHGWPAPPNTSAWGNTSNTNWGDGAWGNNGNGNTTPRWGNAAPGWESRPSTPVQVHQDVPAPNIPTPPEEPEPVSGAPVEEPAAPTLSVEAALHAIIAVGSSTSGRRIVYIRDSATLAANGGAQILHKIFDVVCSHRIGDSARPAIPAQLSIAHPVVIVLGVCGSPTEFIPNTIVRTKGGQRANTANLPKPIPVSGRCTCYVCAAVTGSASAGAAWSWSHSGRMDVVIPMPIDGVSLHDTSGYEAAVLPGYSLINSLETLTQDGWNGGGWTTPPSPFPPFSPPLFGTCKVVSLRKENMSTEQKEEIDLSLRRQATRVNRILELTFSAALHKRNASFEPSELPLFETLCSASVAADSTRCGFCCSHVSRLCDVVLGARYAKQLSMGAGDTEPLVITTADLVQGLSLIAGSDRVKADYFGSRSRSPSPVSEESAEALFMESALEGLDQYETRLRGCIVDKEKLTTTFEDVCVHLEIIDGIRTIVSLPLLHPEFFQTGLLKTEAMDGVLLYGPPGTGKTMLCRAVANECGARMIQVCPSDVNDMYVGESEKLVRAVFSLARRIAPCIVFIDELDALFMSRSHSSSHSTSVAHLSAMVEFMQEMDGLQTAKVNKDKGIVVIGATNRPFALDDAVLRRLPRRMMIDLPGFEQREKILNVYLRDEKVEGINTRELAMYTEYYSGSDLKNLCVSAAMASVKAHIPSEWFNIKRKEKAASDSPAPPSKEDSLGSAAVESSASPEPHPNTPEQLPPPTRTIMRAHFMHAFREVVPSCTETMDSLRELRAWDKVYATYRGAAAMGPAADPERDAQVVSVLNSPASFVILSRLEHAFGGSPTISEVNDGD